MARKSNRKTYNETAMHNPYHSRPATLLDFPFVEDVYSQDQVNPKVDPEKQGWRPSWSRYTSYGSPGLHDTMPAKKAHARKFYEGYEGSDNDPDVDEDYRDPTAFRSIYK